MTLHHGDCIEIMAGMNPESVDAIVTDPPYGLEFMGKEWDRLGDVGKTSHAGPAERDNSSPYGRTRVAFSGSSNVKCRTCGKWQWDHVGRKCECEQPDFPSVSRHQGLLMGAWHQRWAEAAYRIAKPSAYLLAFGGTRTVHRMTCALEDAGWIIRDMLVWGYASGFPKSKASLKPAWEPIVMARKPGPLRMLAIDECRIGVTKDVPASLAKGSERERGSGWGHGEREWLDGQNPNLGRWPANIVLSDELFEPGVPGVVLGGSLTGTMTAWSQSPDSEPSPTASPAKPAAAKSSRSAREANSRASATGHVGMQLDAWATSTDIPKPDIGCSDGTTADDSTTSGNTARSGRTPTAPSLPDTSSITETGTASITGSPTSNSSAEPSTTEPTRPSPMKSSGIVVTPRLGTYETLSDDSVNWRRNSPPAEEPSPGYSRFFLVPKAARSDREPVLGELSGLDIDDGELAFDTFNANVGNTVAMRRRNGHPTVKPVDLMRHLVRLVTPTGGTVLDPFLGSGTTALAAEMEGFDWIGIEREAEYVAIAEARLNGTQRGLGLEAG